MPRERLWWAVVAMAAVLSSLSVGVLPASAAKPPSPANGQPAPDLGILSERRQSMGGGKPVLGHARQTPLAVACGASWRVVSSKDGPWNNFLVGVAAITPTDIWAVGSAQNPIASRVGNADVNLAEHWDGSAWSSVPVPQPGADGNDLNGVAAYGTNNAWAVGSFNSGGFINGQSYQWSGSSWTAATQPSISTPNVLSGVAFVAAYDVWAVGQVIGNNGTRTLVQRTLIEHYFNGSWAIVPSPNVGLGDNALFGVAGSSTSDVWAVGFSRTTVSGPRQSLIEHWDGGSWSAIASPNFSSDTLISVAAAGGSDARAVGYAVGSNGGPVGIALSWNGTWTQQPVSEPSVYNEIITDVVYSAPDYWAVGTDTGNGAAPGPDEPFVLKSSGTTGWLTSGQNGFPAPAVSGTSVNEFFGVGVPAAGDVWAVGSYRTPFNLDKPLVETYSGLAAPTTVGASPGDRSAVVTWTLPCSDGGSAITSYVVTAHDACTIQGSVTVAGAATATANFTGLTNGNSYVFTVAPVNGFGVGPESSASLPIKPAGPSVPRWVTACSSAQYLLTGSDGVTWQPMDSANLVVSFTPSVDSWALLSGNADLWTSNPGFNQDIGVGVVGGGALPSVGAYPSVPGQPEAWKESGGSNGTFSPNAAYVQIVIPVLASKTYTANLQWKANRADPYLIAAGAGPVNARFSPTRLTVQLFPKSANTVFTMTSWSQHRLDFSGGAATSWLDIANLRFDFTPPAGNWIAYISGNADLWTSTGGYNQDIGIRLVGGSYHRSSGAGLTTGGKAAAQRALSARTLLSSRHPMR